MKKHNQAIRTTSLVLFETFRENNIAVRINVTHLQGVGVSVRTILWQ